MIPGYEDFKNLLQDKKIKMINGKFNKTIQKFDLFQVPSVDITDQQIQEHIDESKFIIIDKYTNNEAEYIICCINLHIMIINQSEESLIHTIYSKNTVYDVYNISDNQFRNEIDNFKKEFIIKSRNKDINKFWSIISPSIAAYLIKQSYLETYKDRINEFIKNIYKTNQIKEFKTN